MKLPKRLQSVLWSVNIDHLNLEKDKYYIIHQILIYGSFADLQWLFKTYNRSKITETFLTPYKNYPRNIFYFVKNYILGLKNSNLNENDYVTSIHGSIRQRTPPNFSKA